MTEEKKPRIHEEWEATADEPVRIVKQDGTQMIVHPDGTKEILEESDPRYDHYHGR